MIRTDVEAFQSATLRETRPTGALRWPRIVGLTLLAILGLCLGLVAGALIVVSSGLVELC